VSTRADAVALWGAVVVALALKADPEDPEDPELVRLVAARSRSATSDAAFARWGLSLPWPRFVALVHLVAGKTRRRALTMEN
jgi:hypothetical protein